MMLKLKMNNGFFKQHAKACIKCKTVKASNELCEIAIEYSHHQNENLALEKDKL